MAYEDIAEPVIAIADGAATDFPYPFRVDDAEDVRVAVLTAEGARSTPQIGVDYTLEGIGEAGLTVRFAAPPAAGLRVAVWRDTPPVQTYSERDNREMPGRAIEGALMTHTLALQDQRALLNRANLLPVEEHAGEGAPEIPPRDVRRNSFYGWGEDGEPVARAGPALAIIWQGELVMSSAAGLHFTGPGVVVSEEEGGVARVHISGGGGGPGGDPLFVTIDGENIGYASTLNFAGSAVEGAEYLDGVVTVNLVAAEPGGGSGGGGWEPGTGEPIDPADIPPGAIDFEALDAAVAGHLAWVSDRLRGFEDQAAALALIVNDMAVGDWERREEIRSELIDADQQIIAGYTAAIAAETGPGSALAGRVEVLEAAVEQAGEGPDANALAISGLTTRVNAVEDEIDAQAASILSLGAGLDDAAAGLTAAAGALDALDVRVTSNEGELVSQATRLTTLEANLDEEALNSFATALSALDARVEDNEDGIEAIGQDLTAIEASIVDLNTGVGGNASAINSLDARVTSTEDVNTSQAGQINSLQSSVNFGAAQIAGNASAISALDTRVSEAEGDVAAQASALIGVNAATGGNPANARFGMQVSSGPSGVAARMGMRVRASAGDSFAQSGLYLDALSNGQGRIVLDALKTLILAGGQQVALFDESGLTVSKLRIGDLDFENWEVNAGVSLGGTGGNNEVTGAGAFPSYANMPLMTGITRVFDAPSVGLILYRHLARNSSVGARLLTRLTNSGPNGSRTLDGALTHTHWKASNSNDEDREAFGFTIASFSPGTHTFNMQWAQTGGVTTLGRRSLSLIAFKNASFSGLVGSGGSSGGGSGSGGGGWDNIP